MKKIMTQIMQGKTESVRLCYSAKGVVPINQSCEKFRCSNEAFTVAP